MNTYRILHGDALAMLRTLPDNSVHCVVTSPPYWGLRDYGHDGQIGLEETPDAYVARLVDVFREVRRVLREDGTCWLNLGDSYASGGSGSWGSSNKSTLTTASRNGAWAPGNTIGTTPSKEIPPGLKPKDLVGIPWRVAFALQADGWWLRQDIIWHKTAPMPESVTDRCTKAHEYVFLLTKSARYFYDAQAIAEPSTDEEYRTVGKIRPSLDSYYVADGDKGRTRSGLSMQPGGRATRNKRSVWTLGPEPFSDWGETSRLDRVDSGVLSDGMTHRVFADCPLHGSMCRQDSTEQCDEHGADSLNRTSRTCDCHGQEQVCDCVPIDQSHEQEKQEQSLDLPHQQRELFATAHSTQTSKTDHADQTSQHGTASAQTHSRKHRTSQSSVASEQPCCNGGNNTFVVESGDNPNNQNPVRTVDTSVLPELYEASIDSLRMDGCTCSFYRTITEKTSHFATMPPTLAELCIRAGSSAHGCCSYCGAPWERVVERQAMEVRTSDKGAMKHANGLRTSTSGTMTKPPTAETIGWQPTCTHEAERIPCTVLDPFAGSGTTLAVSLANGRNSIGVELNAEYIRLAEKRITGTQPALIAV